MRRTCCFLFLSFVICHSSFASPPPSTLEGLVSDWSSGEVVPGVLVIATGEDRPVLRETMSDEMGRFRFVLLPPGRYSVTAEGDGYSTLTLVGVDVHPAEIRRVALEIAVADADESVTETVNEPLLPLGFRSLRTLRSGDFDMPPLHERSLREQAALLPGGAVLTSVDDIPVDAVSHASVAGSAFGSNGGRVLAETRTGVGDQSLGVFLRYGDRLTTSVTEESTGASRSDAGRSDAVLWLAGSNGRGTLSGFGLVERQDEDSEYVVNSHGSDPSSDGVTSDASSAVTRVFVALSAQPTPVQSVRFRLQGFDGSHRSGASPLAAPEAVGRAKQQTRRASLSHSWQVSRDLVNELEVVLDTDERVDDAPRGEAWRFPSGYKTLSPTPYTKQKVETIGISERLVALFGAGSVLHELRLGLDGRFGLEESLSFRPAESDVSMLTEAISDGATVITEWSGGGATDLGWNEFSLIAEDVISMGDRIRLSLGASATWWRGDEIDQRGNEIWKVLASQPTFDEPYLSSFQGDNGRVSLDGAAIDPRVSILYDLSGDGTTTIRAAWERFHDTPDLLETLADASLAANGSVGINYYLSDTRGIRTSSGSLWVPGQPLPDGEVVDFVPNDVATPDVRLIETTRHMVGVSKEINELSGLTIDVVSTEYRNLPYFLRANPRLDAEGRPQDARRFSQLGDFRIAMFDGTAEKLEVALGANADLFGKIDAIVSYTWSATEGNVLSGLAGTTAAYQPDRLIGAHAVVDALDPHCAACTGPLDGWPRHRFNLSAATSVFSGWDIGVVFRYRSGLPYTRLNAELSDLDGDGFRQDLEPGVAHVNDANGPSASRLDVRLVRRFAVGGVDASVGVDVFNLLDADLGAGINRMGDATSHAGDPGQPPTRSVAMSVRLEIP